MHVIYRKGRPSRGGGVLIVVSNYPHSVCLSSPPDLEIVTVKLGVDCNLILCTIYVPPSACESYVCSLTEYLAVLESSYDYCIFVGDFNFADIDWLSLSGSSPLSNFFCDFIFACNLTQHVTQPTHVKGNTLDLILTSAAVNVASLSIESCSHFFLSDHFVITFVPTIYSHSILF